MTASTLRILARTSRWSRGVACVVLLAGLSGMPACESPVEPDREPVLESFRPHFSTSEFDARLGHLMLVGKRGGADWLAYTNECWLDAPCPAQVTAELRSSDSSVVTPALQRGRGPQLFFFAMAPGQAYVKLSAQRFKDSILVTVVSEPLPLDDIYVNSGSPADSVLQLQRDSTGNLVGVVLPVRGYAAVWAHGRRAGYQVWMNWTVESSDSAVVAATRNCRPATVDPQCYVVSGGWITGLTRGSATVTFVMRNVRRQVTIVVQ